MNNKTIKNIADNLIAISSQVIPPKDMMRHSFRIHDGVAYGLLNNDAMLFNEQVNIILTSDDYSEKFSEKYISNELKKLFASLLKGEIKDLEKSLTDFFESLSAFERKTTVYLQVTGLRLDRQVKVGKVTFLECDKNLIDNLKVDLKAIIDTLKNDEQSKIFFNKQVCSDLDDELMGKTISMCSFNAEPDRAYERAKEETRKSIDLFHFASKAIYGSSGDIKIGLKGDFSKTLRKGFLFSEDHINTTNDSVGPAESFEVNETNLKRLEEIGFLKLSEFLVKKQPSQFEETLLRSVHWFSSATRQEDVENSFLFMIIALETLFTIEHGNPIGIQIAEGTALILGKDIEQRRVIKKLVKKFYGFRSAISHGGKKQITEGNYYSLLNIVGSAIKILVGKNDTFHSQEDLLKWIEDMKLGSI